jgi:hypothetical protein
MTPQENEKLQQFLGQLSQAQGVQRDPEADAMISAAVSRQPDAAYLLVQRTLLQDQALQVAQARIAELEKQAQAPAAAPAASFLGGADAWGNSARTRPDAVASTAAPSAYPQAGAAPLAPAYQTGVAPAAAPTQGGFLGGMGGGSNFLGTMAATAAGVAGGAFLFQGIGNLMGNHGAKDAGQQHGVASDASTTQTPAASNSLAQDAGVNDVGSTPSQQHAVVDDTPAMDDTAGLDDTDFSDDFGGGDDSMA